jgi:hypothetical protein
VAYAFGILDTHHPLLHTLLLGICVETLGNGLLGSMQAGTVAYIGLQLCLCALALTYLIDTVARAGAPRWLLVLTFLHLGVNPVVALWLHSTTKDVLFTMAAVTLACMLWRHWGHNTLRWRSVAAIAMLAFLFCALRSSGALTLLLACAVAVCLFPRDGRRRLLAAFAAGLAAFAIWAGPVAWGLGAGPGPWQALDALAIPRQQLARVWALGGEQEAFQAVFSQRELAKLYSYEADNADVARAAFREPWEERRGELVALYVAEGIKHPGAYADAALLQGLEAFYPLATVDGYVMPEYSFDPSTSRASNFIVVAEPPVHPYSLLPEFRSWLNQLTRGWLGAGTPLQPLLTIAFSPASYLWLLLVVLARCIITRNRRNLAACALLALIALAALPAPVVVLRYYLPLVAAVPLLCAFVLNASGRSAPRPARSG